MHSFQLICIDLPLALVRYLPTNNPTNSPLYFKSDQTLNYSYYRYIFIRLSITFFYQVILIYGVKVTGYLTANPIKCQVTL